MIKKDSIEVIRSKITITINKITRFIKELKKKKVTKL